MTAGEDADRFETLAWVYSQTELAVLLSRLEHEDIYVLPIARGHASVAWGHTLALGGLELRVHAAEAEDARTLFAGIERTPFRRGVFSDNRLVDGVVMVVLALAGLFVPPARIPAVFVAPRPPAPPTKRESARRPHGRSGPAGLPAGGLRRCRPAP